MAWRHAILEKRPTTRKAFYYSTVQSGKPDIAVVLQELKVEVSRRRSGYRRGRRMLAGQLPQALQVLHGKQLTVGNGQHPALAQGIQRFNGQRVERGFVHAVQAFHL